MFFFLFGYSNSELQLYGTVLTHVVGLYVCRLFHSDPTLEYEYFVCIIAFPIRKSGPFSANHRSGVCICVCVVDCVSVVFHISCGLFLPVSGPGAVTLASQPISTGFVTHLSLVNTFPAR